MSDEAVIERDYSSNVVYHETYEGRLSKSPYRFAELYGRYRVTASGNVWDTERRRWVPALYRGASGGGDLWSDRALVIALYSNGKRFVMQKIDLVRYYSDENRAGRVKKVLKVSDRK